MVGEWQLERQRLEREHTIIHWSRVYNSRIFISCRIGNNDSTLRQKTMGTRGEKKMEGIELMIAIIGAVVILTWYI